MFFKNTWRKNEKGYIFIHPKTRREFYVKSLIKGKLTLAFPRKTTIDEAYQISGYFFYYERNQDEIIKLFSNEQPNIKSIVFTLNCKNFVITENILQSSLFTVENKKTENSLLKFLSMLLTRKR